jgi:hypothetical protein
MRSRRVEPWLAVAAVVLALAPLAVALITWVGSDWVPIHDVAVTDMRVRDVWSSDTPLVGPYSRYLWNHPGPVMFWMMAVPSALSGQAAWGTLVGGVLIQAIAVVWAGVLSWKIGRLTTVVLTMAAMLVTVRSIGPLVVLEPWNPHVALPWFVLFVLYAWQLAAGRWRRLPGAFFVASFLVQTHIGYLPLVGAATAVALVYLVVDRRRSRIEPVGVRAFVLTGIIAVVLWAPVVVEQLTSSRGNLSLLADYFLGGQTEEPRAGLRAATGLAGAAFGVPPPWLGGDEARDYLTGAIRPGGAWLIVVPVVLLAVGLVGTHLAGRRDHQRYVVVVAAVFGAGVLALSRITGDLLDYLFYWRTPLAVMVLVAAGVGVFDWVDARQQTAREQTGRPALATAGTTAGMVLLAALSIPPTIAVATHGDQVKPFEEEVAAVLDQIDTDAVDGTVLVRFDGSTIGGLQGGLTNALDRDGVDARVDESLSFQFGEDRVAAPDEVDEIWYALEDGYLTSFRVSDPHGRVVARLMPLGAEAEDEIVALQLQLADQLAAAGRSDLWPTLDSDLVAYALDGIDGVDPEATARLADWNARLRELETCRCSVVAFAPEHAPTDPPQPAP